MPLLSLLAVLLAAVPTYNQPYQFSFTAPDGFEPAASSGADTLYTFRKGRLESALALGIEHLGGTIGREKLEAPQLNARALAKKMPLAGATWA